MRKNSAYPKEWDLMTTRTTTTTKASVIAQSKTVYFSPDGWSIICSPFIPKYLSSPRSVSMDGTIYLIGDNTKKVYLYDPDANMWQKVRFIFKSGQFAMENYIFHDCVTANSHWFMVH